MHRRKVRARKRFPKAVERRRADVREPPDKNAVLNAADRAGVPCYRVYDADMPEYAIAVDVYNDWAHIAEYQAPKSVDERAASQRLEDALSAVPHALGLNSQQVVLKRRTKQRGSQQYVRQNDQGDMMEVAEGDVKLLVNLHDYLDTGLFLDHRKRDAGFTNRPR